VTLDSQCADELRERRGWKRGNDPAPLQRMHAIRRYMSQVQDGIYNTRSLCRHRESLRPICEGQYHGFTLFGVSE
jgi:hypothetical protein